MTAQEAYEQAREENHRLRGQLLFRPWWRYVLQPLQTMALVQLYLHSDTLAWVRMHELLIQMAADQNH